MPEKTKTYKNIRFTPDVIKEADNIFRNITGKKEAKPNIYIYSVDTSDDESWSHNNEAEFFADYSKGFYHARFWKNYPGKGNIDFSVRTQQTQVSVALDERKNVEEVFNYLEANVDKCRLPKQPDSELKKSETNWVDETVNKISTHCPSAARRLKLALIDIESEDKEK